MSKDKNARIFSPQMKAVVFIILQIFFATLVIYEIWEFHSDSSQFRLGNIQSRDKFTFRLIVCERKYLMDYKLRYSRVSK